MAEKQVQFTGEMRIEDVTLSNTIRSGDGQPPDETTVAGRVLTATSGAPLSGLRVRVTVDAGPEQRNILAETQSDTAGSFALFFRRAEADPQALLLSAHEGSGPALLELPVPDDPERRRDVVLRISLPDVRLTNAVWKELGQRLEKARIGRTSLMVRELQQLGSGAFADWPLAKRLAVLAGLESAFLDPTGTFTRAGAGPLSFALLQDAETLQALATPATGRRPSQAAAKAFRELTGKVASFQSLAEVDWPLIPADFIRGDAAKALTRFADAFVVGADIDANIFGRTSERIRYRDYLRAIWTDNAPKVVFVSGTSLTGLQARLQLETRFHQNFRTVDETDKPANEVLIPIVTEILVSATGANFGFGVPPASIPPRGTRTAREYLDFLIGLSGLSAREFGLRYRLDLGRPDSAVSNRVQENVATLQGFFRDTFQCSPEPINVAPDVLNAPIVTSKMQGDAPFFLHYEEWLRQQQKFHPENFLDLRALMPVPFEKNSRDRLSYWAGGGTSPYEKGFQKQWQMVAAVLAVVDALFKGHAEYYNGEYRAAKASYDQAHYLANLAVADSHFNGFNPWPLIATRKALPLTSMPEVAKFEREFGLSTLMNSIVHETSARDLMALRLWIFALYVIPVCRGDAALALGDFEHAVFHYGQATRFAVGMAHESDSGGYKPVASLFTMYSHGDKPFTVDLRVPGQGVGSSYPNESDIDDYRAQNAIEGKAYLKGLKYAHVVETRVFKLRQGNAMLEWADSLYRANDQPSIARARELYKGVLWLWGETPPIQPTWPREFPFPWPIFEKADQNPAIAGQKTRARLGFYKIEAGLNYFGETDEIVPVLRYRPLKENADRMGALAKAAQIDFLHSTEKVEDALTERMRLNTLLQKSALQSAIGTEQIAIAQADVQVAKDQVAAVEAAIAAKKAEIAKADSFFSQLGDFFGGMAKTVTALPTDTKSAVGAGVASEVTGKEMVGQGMLGLGAGASIMTGFGVFAVAGYMSMSSMADAANARMSDLATLTGKALPAAQRAVVSREHGVKIAQLQKAIADLDRDLATNLIAFEENKMLNLGFWVNVAQVARRLMRRYLDLGGRIAWLAERALAYEQDRRIRLVRLDYHLERLQGVTGADLLQLDLAELEATRIEGFKRTLPVKRTVSLAREFPLSFGQLKANGRCVFRTLESEFRRAYPGTRGYRVRTISVVVSQVDFTNPLRGTLLNQGVSVSHPGETDAHALVRPAEALPLSEFQMRNDMAVYSLPDETLLPFEGSAIETFWELNFPKQANPSGVETLADVLVTFDLRAQFLPEKYASDILALPATVRRWVLMSGAVFDAAAIAGLRGTDPSITVDFDIARLGLPSHETKRKVKNVVVLVADPASQDVKATFQATTPATPIALQMKKGVAMSTLQPDPTLPSLPVSPLDALADVKADQRFRLTIVKAQNPGVSFAGVRDVILAVEYAADIV